MEIDNNISTIIIAVGGFIFGWFLKIQNEYNNKLKTAYDEKVELLVTRINSLENKLNKYEEKINKLNNKIFLLQEEYEINVPVLIHKDNGDIIFQNKHAVGIHLNSPELQSFFQRVKRLKKSTIEININNEQYLVATCMKEYPLNDVLITFLFSK